MKLVSVIRTECQSNVLPRYQGQGIGSALINAMVVHLFKQGIDQFCLDRGYKRAQKGWSASHKITL